MTIHVRVAIIGGGIAGCSLLCRLVERGCRDVILIEKGELTSGSTWHAAGNVPFFMPPYYRNLTPIHKMSFDYYAEFESRSGRSFGVHRCGSLEVATSREESHEQRAYCSAAESAGIDFEVLEPSDVSRLFPYVSTDGIVSAAWTPTDGHVDPATLTMAFADQARAGGARILRHRRVTGLERRASGDWKLDTGEEDIVAEHIVNAAGLHAREVSRMVGHVLPAVPLERQYLVTDSLPGIGELSRELPILRDASVPLYARQEGDAMLLGLPDREPVFWAIEETPPDFDQELLPPDLDRASDLLEKAMRRLPVLNEVGIKRVINGPLLCTPDACPLIGPVPGIDNYWLNTGYKGGIAQGGHCAGILARWLLDGDPGEDVQAIAASRFDERADIEQAILPMMRRAYAQELGQNVIDGTNASEPR